MEIILFVKFYHTSDGSSFTSVSTYLQNNSSGCPSYKPRCFRVSASQMCSNMPLFPHREGILSQGSMGIMSLLGNQLAWYIQTEENPPTLGPPILYIVMAFSMNIFGILLSMFFNHCIPRIHSIKSHLE